MKTLLLLLFPLFIFSQQKKKLVNFHLLSEFAVNKNEENRTTNNKIYARPILAKGDTLSCYEITKIDSLGIYYLIEAKNSKYVYKIVSEKKNAATCKTNIKVGKVYQLDLRSVDDKCSRTHIDPDKIGFPRPMSSGSLGKNDMVVYDFYGEYRIMYGLYNEALNLNGLCYTNTLNNSRINIRSFR
ncbi:hypothetical protein DBB36_22745 [Flavobacterium sp. WLB]|uniref:hypothetical protein n=1 Tax=unclassified Flavobacterium TaxID=196869 RepID=UPI0006ABBFAD|nr:MULTISPECIES: hypothetical protein [unclassified Flavobacterium]KOP36112.1 hypothetical protein AKO67_22160 [Flavobacterium sp. VMW]OWU89326.1 hypothetical protein APR43_19225 [Flavobacterium sp. NLM]PUU67677.1 hypothetical protein DBB36_22745 [Flavobacterium sp. WLB]